MKRVFDEKLDDHFKMASGWNEAIAHLEDCQWGEGVYEDYPFEKGEAIRIHVERHPVNTILTPDLQSDVDNLSSVGMNVISRTFKGKAVYIGQTALSEYIATIKSVLGLKHVGISTIDFPDNNYQWLGLSAVIDVTGEYLLHITFCISIDNMPEELKKKIFQTDPKPEVFN